MPAVLQTACAYARWYLDFPESMFVSAREDPKFSKMRSFPDQKTGSDANRFIGLVKVVIQSRYRQHAPLPDAFLGIKRRCAIRSKSLARHSSRTAWRCKSDVLAIPMCRTRRGRSAGSSAKRSLSSHTH